jgi:hypothetical protein
MLRRQDEALADLKIALAPGAAAWVQGRAHLEMARLAIQRGDRATAEREADRASEICGQGSDPFCVAEAKKIR